MEELAVLRCIIERDLGQAVVVNVLAILVKLDDEARLGVERLEAAVA